MNTEFINSFTFQLQAATSVTSPARQLVCHVNMTTERSCHLPSNFIVHYQFSAQVLLEWDVQFNCVRTALQNKILSI